MECLLPYLCLVTVPHIMVGLERMLDYRGVGLARFHCIQILVTFNQLKLPYSQNKPQDLLSGGRDLSCTYSTFNYT